MLSFFLPLGVMLLILATKGIWWGSDTTILASDSFHQYVIFAQTIRNTLHGDGSLFYTFTSGLGLNLYALSAYYLGSFLTPFFYFFGLQSMPDAIYLVTLVKFGLTGLSMFASLKGIYKSLKNDWGLLLSTSFSLMSFSTSQLEILSWLDVFILLPIILLGLHKLITGRGRFVYYISLSCLFIQNYYFGYMTAIFLSLWMLVQLSWDIKKRLPYIIDFTVVSILSAGTSAIMLLPTYLDLKYHGETFTKIVNLKTEDTWYLDFFAKQFVGSFDTTKFGSIPMIYVGLLPLLLALTFFTLKTVKWQVKLANFSLFAVIIASFYLQPLNLFWQGMHAPNMFLYRYSWTLSTIVIYLAAETLTRWTVEKTSIKSMTTPFLFLGTGLLLTVLFRNHYDFLQPIHLILTFEFILAYAFIFFIAPHSKPLLKMLGIICLAFGILEIGLHTHFQVEGISQEWHFPSRSNYEDKLTDIDKLVKDAKIDDPQFYRTERLLPQTGNDSMKYNYNGISQFSSIRNRSSSSILDKLGFRSDGTNLNLRYQNNTIIADSLFAIKYNLASQDPSKFGFSHSDQQANMQLYENSYNQGLALLTEGLYKDVKFTNRTLDNQSNFLNQLTSLNHTYFTNIPVLQSQNVNEFGSRVTVNKREQDDAATVTYQLTVPAMSQVYLNLPNITFSNEQVKKVFITVNNQSSEFTLDNSFSFFNVGYFLEEQTIEVTVHFPENHQVSFDKPQFYRLDLTAYQQAMGILAAKNVSTQTKGNMVITDFTTDKEASLLFTLPYDAGWTAAIDGEPTTILRAQNGFMKLNVKTGQKQVILTFKPQGFTSGFVISIFSLLIFLAYQVTRNHWMRKTAQS